MNGNKHANQNGTMTGKPNNELTTVQRLAWSIYKRFEKKRGRAPSVREYMALLGSASFGGTQRMLNIFRERGLIKAPRVITESRLTAKGRKQ